VLVFCANPGCGFLSPNNPTDIACQTKTADDQKAILKAEEYNAED
jgi:hypothetical protein